jgi:DNA-binding Lrp family transcriptional regulator
MNTVFVRIKCSLGMTFSVAKAIMDTIEETAAVYSTSGKYDLLVQFRLPVDRSIGRFVNERVHCIKDICDTNTMIVFDAFRDDSKINA